MGQVAQVCFKGEVYGRLTVLGEAAPAKVGGKSRRVRRVVCLCACGKHVIVAAFRLRNGGTASCGCLRRESRGGNKHHLLHGGSRTPTYRTWCNIIQRCENPSSPGWSVYGAREIRVCPRWKESFAAFLADVGERPTLKHSIDRIDNNKGYEPGNVRWATAREQSRNKRNNKWFEYKGERMILPDWAQRLSVPVNLLSRRLRQGWPLDKVFSAERAYRSLDPVAAAMRAEALSL